MGRLGTRSVSPLNLDKRFPDYKNVISTLTKRAGNRLPTAKSEWNNLAANDIKVLKNRYGTELFRTETNIKLGMAPGDCVIVAGTGTNFVDLLLDGMPTRGTDIFVGVTDSSANNVPNTASADGLQSVQLAGPGTILQGQGVLASNTNTDAKLKLILNDVCNFNRSAATAAGILTINTTTTTAAKSTTLSLVIISGDITKGSIRVAVQTGFFASNI